MEGLIFGILRYQAKLSCVIMSMILMTGSVLQSIDITRRNLTLITVRA